MVREEVELRPLDAPGPRPSTIAGLVRTARPKQWAKNVLVFAAPGAAGVLGHEKPLVRTLVAFVCFCLAASGTYFLNDVADVDSDRLHPTKRNRPLAAGIVSVSLGRAVGVVLVLVSIALGFTARWELAVTVAGYVALTTVYSAYLKHVAVVDIVAVAAGFVLRTVAGATATGVPISDWFFIVASFGSLFMVAGKRHAERLEVGDDAQAVRSTLGDYSDSFLAYLRAVSSGTVFVAYCLWAFEKADAAHASVPYYQLSILPFVLGVLRYALLVDQGKGAAPEDVVLGDRPLQLIGVLWAIVFGLGIYVS
ncbi:MAG TPA: decaprenyl-phosphate phosphoribosyltransferase [Acidimicrobiales bacterium]|jgi:decaprenyl-phosphate phosphoribosyltransferase|nr:decaprenyl-phosphate phosphoribosyltransferase [Acidimicrobiales bacterium]